MKIRLLIIIISLSGLLAGCGNQKTQTANFDTIEQFMAARSSGFELEPEHYDSLGIHANGLAKRFEATFPK